MTGRGTVIENAGTQTPDHQSYRFLWLLYQRSLKGQRTFRGHLRQQRQTDFVNGFGLALIYRNLSRFVFRFRLLTQDHPALDINVTLTP